MDIFNKLIKTTYMHLLLLKNKYQLVLLFLLMNTSFTIKPSLHWNIMLMTMGPLHQNILPMTRQFLCPSILLPWSGIPDNQPAILQIHPEYGVVQGWPGISSQQLPIKRLALVEWCWVDRAEWRRTWVLPPWKHVRMGRKTCPPIRSACRQCCKQADASSKLP